MSEIKSDEKVNENGYSKKKVWSVPPKCVLVCKNKITGNIYQKGTGLRVNLPFVRAKLIEVASRTDGIDNNDKVTNKCLDGFEVTVNPAITTRVVDAVKYEFNSKNPETELRVKIQNVLMKLISVRHYENLIGLEIDLDNVNFQFFRNEFMDIENKYGLRLEKIYIQSVELSQSMKDDYEKRVIQEKENERKLLEAQTKEKVAQLEAEAEKAKLRAIREVTLEFIDQLKNKGLSNSDITNIIAYTGVTNESDTKIISIGNSSEKGSSIITDAATAGVVLKKIK